MKKNLFYSGKFVSLSVVVFALLLLAVPVSAQTLLDYDLTPIRGTSNLNEGFGQLRAKMHVEPDVAVRNTLSDCSGYTTEAPAYRIHLSGDTDYLRFFTISEGDTILVVNDPFGRWYCNDDFDGLNSQINFNNAPDGQYDIWVGSFSGADISVTLVTSEYTSYVYPDGLDHVLDPEEFSFELESGFLPDPWSGSLLSGGNEYIPDTVTGDGCRGYTTDEPTYTLNWSGGGDYLRFYVDSNADTTMIINDPNGRWYCNDDFNGLDPQISFRNPIDGEYDIWVGSYTYNIHSATLYVSEYRDSGSSSSLSSNLSATVSGTSSLRARYGPGVNYQAVSSANGGILYQGARVTLMGRAPQQPGSSIWVQLEGTTTRWVNSRYLSISGDILDLPITWNS